MYIMGENPMLSDPNLTHVEEGLRSLDFLVVQDIFLSESAQLAHVVLPAAASLEKDGTVTNTERRVQLLAPCRAGARPGAHGLGDHRRPGHGARCEAGAHERAVRWQFATTAEIAAEAAGVTPIYGGMLHHRLHGEGAHVALPHAGASRARPSCTRSASAAGWASSTPCTPTCPAEQPDAEYPLILSTGRILYHYHTGTMTRRSEGLDWVESKAYAEVNPVDAAAVNLRDGGPVIIHSRCGQVRTQARISERAAGRGLPLLPLEGGARQLCSPRTLRWTRWPRSPEYKVSAIRLENPSRRA